MNKKVVIIGGGFAGSHAAKHLEKKFDVTLIDTKNYFEFTPGILRSIVEPAHVRKIQVLHSHYLHRARIIVGKVDEVNEEFVRVGKKKIKFDYLVVSSGSTYNSPFKEQRVVTATRAAHLRENYEKLCRAKRVLIVGGGLVGVELAGEICDRYPEKEIVIVHSKDRLIDRNHKKAIKYAERFLISRGVEIAYGQRVKEVKGKLCLTDKNVCFEADLIFLCTGIKSNFELMKNNFSKSLDDKNRLRVNEFLQVSGVSKGNIFAAGDLTDVKEEKTAQNAERQAKVVVDNICNFDSGHEMVKYKPKSRPLVISLGKKKAIFDSGGFVLRGWFPSLMKEVIEWYEMKKKRKVD
jgi:NADH dehydrogenase FAD-containing subunit